MPRKMITNISTTSPVSYLREEYERDQALFNAQPVIVQRFIETQARRLAEAVINNASQVSFVFPDRVIAKTPKSGEMAGMLLPGEMREQTVGGWWLRFDQQSMRDLLRLRLSELEQSPDKAINSSTSLLRYAMAIHMVYNMLPDGRSVNYQAEGEEQIPTIPVKVDGESESALTSSTDAIAEQSPAEGGRGDLQVPFVPAARRFYLPQWVSFDDKGNLLVNSVSQAEANQASMERYVAILHAASSLVAYIVVDETYQRKRYGMLGQVINQGRALAKYKTGQIIKTILERIEKGMLNRGLSISLPYYDDQGLHMVKTELEVIPAGRIMFKAVFVVRAARLEHAKVAQDTRLNSSTRKHLLSELDMLQAAFINFPK
jgi:hypothetical protein